MNTGGDKRTREYDIEDDDEVPQYWGPIKKNKYEIENDVARQETAMEIPFESQNTINNDEFMSPSFGENLRTGTESPFVQPSPPTTSELNNNSINLQELKKQIFNWFGGVENCNKMFVVNNEKNDESDYLGLECIKNDKGDVTDFDIRDKTGTPIIATHPNLLKDSTPLIEYFRNLLPPPIPVEFDSKSFATPTTNISSLKQMKFYPIQFSNNMLDKIDDIFDTLNAALKIKEVYEETNINSKISLNLPEIKKDEPTTITSFIQKFDQDKKDKIEAVMLCFSFIRSYIDFYHDYEYLARPQLQKIKETLLNNSQVFKNIKNLKIFDGITIGKYMQDNLDIIDFQAVTSSGNVNQTTCKKILKNYMEKYCQILIDLGVYWLTPNKESAFIYSTKTCSIKKTNCDVEIKNSIQTFIDKLKEDNIELFYTETDKSNISEILVQNGFNMTSSLSGIRDAGSGFSMKTAKNINNNVKNISIYRTFDNNNININTTSQKIKNTNDYLITNSPACLSSKFLFFDLFNIIIDNNEKSNNFYLTNIDNSSVNLIANNNDKIEPLSINSVLETVKMRQLRGQGKAPALRQIEITNMTDICKSGILSFKTFTDFIQLLDIHDVKDSGLYPVFITLDMLCEDSGMLFGLPTIRSENHYASYYCYDTRYHSIDPMLMQRKLNAFLRIVSNAEIIKEQITNGIFKPIREYLIILKKYHFNPCIYYAANFLLNEITEIEQSTLQKIEDIENKYDEFNENSNKQIDINYLKLIPHDTNAFIEWKNNLQTTDITNDMLLSFNGDLNLFMEQMCDFSSIKGTFINTSNLFMEQFDIIRNIENRTSAEDFKKLYYNTKQELINFLPKSASEAEIDFNIFLIFLTAFSTKNKKAQSSIQYNISIFLSDDDVEKKDKDIINKVNENIGFINILETEFLKIGETTPIIQNYIDVFVATELYEEDSSLFKSLPYSLIYSLMYEKNYGTNPNFGDIINSHFKGGKRKQRTLKTTSNTRKKRITKYKRKNRKTVRKINKPQKRTRKSKNKSFK
jgi:hypothetical protein